MLWFAPSLSSSTCSSQPGFFSTTYLFCPPPTTPFQNKTHPCFPSTGRDNSDFVHHCSLGHLCVPLLQSATSLWVPESPLQARVHPLLPHSHTGKQGICPICSASTSTVACPASFLQLTRGQGEEKGWRGRENSPLSAGSPSPHIACLQLLPCFSLPACHLLLPHKPLGRRKSNFIGGGRTFGVYVKGAANQRERKPSGVERKARRTWGEKLFVVLLRGKLLT